jgi:hypothetical protein
MSRSHCLSELGHPTEAAFDLGGVGGISVANPLLQLVETTLLVGHQPATLVAVVCIDGADKAPVRVHCSPQLQHPGDGRIGRAGLAECEGLRVDLVGSQSWPSGRKPALGYRR